jgi:ATP-dependent Lon protease
MKNKKQFELSDLLSSEAEFIPLLSAEDEDFIRNTPVPEELAILPLRNTVLFPGVVIPITVGREKSIQLVKENYKSNKLVGVVAQKDMNIEDPVFEDMFEIGTLARIIKSLQMPDGTTTIIIQGVRKFRIIKPLQLEPYHMAQVESYDFEKDINHYIDKAEFKAIVDTMKDLSLQIVKNSPNLPSEAGFAIKNIESPNYLIHFISSNLNVGTIEKQLLLEMNDVYEFANQVLKYLSGELELSKLKSKIQDKVKHDLDKQQRDYFLSQQLKTIQEELGGNPIEETVKSFKERAAKKKWDDETSQIFEKELQKLSRLNIQSPDYSIQVNYLETFVELPWNEYTIDNLDLLRCRKILDKDHYGLEKVKDRIIDYLAVLKLKGDMKSPILCLYGPPGVGKTSLGKSIAEALGRKYIRVSLGGLRDESEIRGHRKTYIGAMPGRIIQSMKKAKSANPVFVLDEIDKVLGMNISGDPSAALLEVLDPEQNNSFYDNFLETGFDLSKVLFIATANNMSNIHPALRDRMEVIDISGYSIEEKEFIAKRHLIPKQLLEHGMTKDDVNFSPAIIRKVIEDYTRESGVRGLERNVAKLIRSKARYKAMDEFFLPKFSVEEVEKVMGPPMFKREKALKESISGVAVGLAWTAVGGEILFVEASVSKGKGALSITGNLGDVMKESATIAFEYIKAHSLDFNIEATYLEQINLHIHVPEGATPKDGPSAGITLLTAMVSALTRRVVDSKYAMTGEITLRGKVLPVGGIKEKILAARRAAIYNIILSAENRKDVLEIEDKYRKEMNFNFVDSMDEVIAIVLTDRTDADLVKF